MSRPFASDLRLIKNTVYMLFVNRYRNNKYGEPDKEQSKEAGMRDHTEFENKDFRYVL